jgi:thiamine biosynthesis lipoprotein
MAQRRQTTRRKFLTGEAAVEALGDLTHGTTGEAAASTKPFHQPPTTQAAQTFLVHFSRWAMACEFQVFLTADHPADGPEAALAALDLIDRLEDQLSVYREHSELSRINRTAASQPVVVERRLFELLQYAVELFHETDGAFDITAGPLSKAWGFFQRQGRVPDDGELQESLAHVGSQHLILDLQEHTIHFAREGMELNPGAIGKGYALDRAAALMSECGVGNFLMHGGRSSVLARGTRIPAASEDNPWTVAIGHPLKPERELGLVVLRDQALSTSGSGTQSFHHQGQRYGHVLDPRTGRPAQGVLSVVVVADDAAAADALSTALYVLGPEKAAAFCAAHPRIGAVVVLPSDAGQAVEVRTFNLPAGRWQILE